MLQRAASAIRDLEWEIKPGKELHILLYLHSTVRCCSKGSLCRVVHLAGDRSQLLVELHSAMCPCCVLDSKQPLSLPL
jgi:hypothetical protein